MELKSEELKSGIISTPVLPDINAISNEINKYHCTAECRIHFVYSQHHVYLYTLIWFIIHGTDDRIRELYMSFDTLKSTY